jgi:predicted nucleic acid-binding protein
MMIEQTPFLRPPVQHIGLAREKLYESSPNDVHWGFRTYDALHLACAEQASVNIFLTTGDRVLRIAASHAEELHVRVVNPLTWLVEVR